MFNFVSDERFRKPIGGIGILGSVVAQVMKSASFEGYHSNHSLRRTCATQLYDKRLPEQLFQAKKNRS